MADGGAISLAAKLALITDHWTPLLAARVNDMDVRLVKIKGAFVWHAHAAADELFLVVEGAMTIHLRHRDVELEAGEMFVVPRGVEHNPSAREECAVLLLEPSGTVNTGDVVVAGLTRNDTP